MKISRKALSWAVYDWANSAFAVIVLTGFFPIFFREYWAKGQASEAITLSLGIANSTASVLIVLLAPILGSIADQGGYKKPLLILLAILGAGLTSTFYFVGEQQYLLALALFVLATVSWMGANVFYDALMLDIAEPQDFDQISTLGFALGYLGSGLLFSFCVWMTLSPTSFGLAHAGAAIQLSFLLTAIWWVVFTLPLMRNVPGTRLDHKLHVRTATIQGFRQLFDTFKHILNYRQVWIFLIAYWLYIDGVDTVIRMAVDYGKALGFGTNDLITALLITQFVGFPAALGFGWIAGKTGTRNAILLGLAAYAAITLWASRMQDSWEFYALAVCIGLIQGGIQALSRSMFAQLIDKERSAEFFGFYNMMGKFAAIIGPIMVGWVGYIFASPRIGIVSLLGLFLSGAAMLLLIPNRIQHSAQGVEAVKSQ
ncbi:MAG: MFS transporter [Thiotrichales bacterium]